MVEYLYDDNDIYEKVQELNSIHCRIQVQACLGDVNRVFIQLIFLLMNWFSPCFTCFQDHVHPYSMLGVRKWGTQMIQEQTI